MLFELYTSHKVSDKMLYLLAVIGVNACDFCLEWHKATRYIVCWYYLNETIYEVTRISSLTQIKTLMTLDKFCHNYFQNKNRKSAFLFKIKKKEKLTCPILMFSLWYRLAFVLKQTISFEFFFVLPMLHMKKGHGNNIWHFDFTTVSQEVYFSEKFWHFSSNQSQIL